jgi:DNA helicase-2/ATP-dependent DNA helicase PcrA
MSARDALFSDLTEAQREAVRTIEGPVLILAAAGSGKTRVITRRIAYLLSIGVPAWRILALTFTNKAAGEMRGRVERLLAADPARSAGPPTGLTITTFHALCARLLRRYAPLMEGAPRWGIRADYTIYDADDQQSLMKRVIAESGVNAGNWPPRSVLARVSSAKNELRDAASFAAEAGNDFHGRMIAKFYERYERALRAANAVDFDDLLMLTVRLLRESEAARGEVQGRWKHMMIDEYQDTNHAQFVLSTLLIGESEAAEAASVEGLPGVEGDGPGTECRSTRKNVCVVGDPDQSIYGWRGADIANILDFEEQYPGAKVIKLGRNFRSTSPILKAADALIKHNKQRKDKPLFTEEPGGVLPEVVRCRDEHHEAAVVLEWMRGVKVGREHAGGPEACPTGESENTGRLKACPTEWRDFAVFYRNNALSRVMEDALRQAGVPYVIVRGTAFYQREEVKDAIAYLRVVANAADEVSLRRILNKPARKIGSASLEALAAHAERSGGTLFEAMRGVEEVGLGAAAAGAVRKFVGMVEGWSGGGRFLVGSVPSSLAELVGRVISESGLEAHYRAAKTKGGEEDAQRLANLEELVSSARDFEEEYEAAGDPGAHDDEQGATTGIVRPGGPSARRLAHPERDGGAVLLGLLRAYLERVSLVADADALDSESGAVTLMTLHAAKGLEFPAVAMIGLEEGILPSARALEGPGDDEEERRLCFVGLTRAMRRLLITNAKYRSVRGLRERAIPSRFLNELPRAGVAARDESDEWEECDVARASGGTLRAGGPGVPPPGPLPRGGGVKADDAEWPVGSKVRHPQFGVGTVRRVTGLGVNRRATVAFLQAGEKTLILQYARLERV